MFPAAISLVIIFDVEQQPRVTSEKNASDHRADLVESNRHIFASKEFGFRDTQIKHRDIMPKNTCSRPSQSHIYIYIHYYIIIYYIDIKAFEVPTVTYLQISTCSASILLKRFLEKDVVSLLQLTPKHKMYHLLLIHTNSWVYPGRTFNISHNLTDLGEVLKLETS